jgi:hypothetical protein
MRMVNAGTAAAGNGLGAPAWGQVGSPHFETDRNLWKRAGLWHPKPRFAACIHL